MSVLVVATQRGDLGVS